MCDGVMLKNNQLPYDWLLVSCFLYQSVAEKYRRENLFLAVRFSIHEYTSHFSVEYSISLGRAI